MSRFSGSVSRTSLKSEEVGKSAGVEFEPEVSHGYPKLSCALFFSIPRFELLSGILQEASRSQIAFVIVKYVYL